MQRSRLAWPLLATLVICTLPLASCTDDPVAPDSGTAVPTSLYSVTSADADLEDSFNASETSDLVKRHPNAVCTLDGGPVVIEGSIDLTALGSGGAVMIGLIDQGLHDTYGATTDTWASGAYAFFGNQGTLRIGPSDGRDSEGEFSQVGANIAMPGLPATLDFTLTVDPATNEVTVNYAGTDYTDDYGPTEAYWAADAYAGGEFDNGALIGVDIWNADVTYRLEFVSGCTLTGTDEEGPVASDVEAVPNPVPVGGTYDLSATVDDTDTGNSNIASASWTLYDAMAAVVGSGAMSGTLDSPLEDVTATGLVAPTTPGLYDLCVSGTDAAGNTGAETCTTLIAYDPEGGFVTGGGWFTSPPGAFDGSDGVVRVDGNPDDGWGFNLEPPYVTSAGYGTGAASIGMGSVHVDPITNAAGDEAKFALQYNPAGQIPIADFEGFSIDFMVDPASTNVDTDQFYVNVYTLTPDPSDGGWYDCRFDYVASGGSTSSWTPIALDGATAPDGSGDKLGGTCPATLDGMPEGSTIFRITVNLGDTSGNDTGVGGYFDNARLEVGGSTTAFDFEPAITGKASFGFVAKYKKGATTPHGNTQFTFEAGDLNFHSTSYDWLVVTGANQAKFKGVGTVNGAGPYKFQLWAGDGDPDTFRIKIWEEVDGSEVVVYDNGQDQAIEGGQIIVHDGKGKK